MLFHEMVHAYHWREGTRINDYVTGVYEKVMKKGIYEKVKYIYGQTMQHYCKNNEKEYLAETAEAFFTSKRFRNDYYPFIHSELKSYDAEGYDMIVQVFKLKPEWVLQFEQNFEHPEDYDPKT